MTTLLGILLGFLLGSIPCGLLLTRRAGLGDIRAIGSGNIGATNVLRTGRRDLAALTLVLDVVKGTAAVLLARRIGGDGALAGVAAVLGHTLTPWLRFRGGKGVATGLGALLGMFWPLGCIVGASWILALALSRISSVAALSACAVAVIGAIAWPAPSPAPVLAVAAWITWRHRANIGRLRAGTEPKVGR
jgi:glycerol-3-phosphate acyltransferase PlsY